MNENELNNLATSTAVGEGGGKGTMIGSIIVIIIIIIGAVYFFSGSANAPTGPDDQAAGESNILDANQPTPDASDDLSAIESDLNVVSQDTNTEVNAIEQGLGQ